ncbi:hypothetical protein [Microbacterium sp. GXF7504]
MPGQSGFVNAALNSFNHLHNEFEYEVELTAVAKDSFNTDSSDNSIHDNDVDVSIDSHDSYTKLVDKSVNAGNREYNTGFGDIGVGGATLAAAAGGGGDLFIDNRPTITDQSSNSVVSGKFVNMKSENEAVVSSGDNSVAAGGDVVSVLKLDNSVNIKAGDDVVFGDKMTVTNTAINSGNTWSYESNEWELEIEDSFNFQPVEVDIEDSFTVDSHDHLHNETEVEVDVNAIVGSIGAAIID